MNGASGNGGQGEIDQARVEVRPARSALGLALLCAVAGMFLWTGHAIFGVLALAAVGWEVAVRDVLLIRGDTLSTYLRIGPFEMEWNDYSIASIKGIRPDEKIRGGRLLRSCTWNLLVEQEGREFDLLVRPTSREEVARLLQGPLGWVVRQGQVVDIVPSGDDGQRQNAGEGVRVRSSNHFGPSVLWLRPSGSANVWLLPAALCLAAALLLAPLQGTSEEPSDLATVLIVSVGFLWIAAVATKNLLWISYGCDIVLIGRRSLAIVSRLGACTFRRRRYDPTRIACMRVASRYGRPRRRTKGATIVFDYDGQEVDLVSGNISRGEAFDLVNGPLARFTDGTF